MKKRTLFLFVVMVLCLGSATLLDKLFDTSDPLEQLRRDMEVYLQQTTSEVNATFAAFDADSLRLHTQNPWLNWYIYESDRLVYWTGTDFLQAEVPSLDNFSKDTPSLLNQANGSSLVFFREFQDGGKHLRFLAVLTLYQKFPVSSSYLLDRLILNGKDIQAPASISSEPTPYPVHDVSGRELFFLERAEQFYFSGGDYLVILLYLAGFIFLIALVHSQAIAWSSGKRSLLTAMAFLFAVLFIREWMDLILIKRFEQVPFFAQELKNSALARSLGELLVNSFMLLWMMIYFHGQFLAKPIRHIALSFRMALGTANFFIIATALLLISKLLETLVTDPNLDFDFDNIFAIDIISLIAVFSILLGLFSLFLFSHRLMLTLAALQLPFRQKIISMVIALGLVTPLVFYLFEGLEAWSILFIGLIYLSLFDLFTDSRSPGLSWLVIWLAFFSAFTSFILFRFNLQKDLRKWQNYATLLASQEDPLAEKGLQLLGEKLLQDSLILGYFNTPVPFSVEAQLVQQAIDPYFTEDNYLFTNYDYTLHIINLPFQESLIRNQSPDYALQLSSGKIGIRESVGHPEVFLPRQYQSGTAFFWKKTLPTPGNPNSRNEIYLSLSPRRKDHTRLYGELLLEIPYKGLTDLNKFDFAVYHEKTEVLKNGQVNTGLMVQAADLEPGEQKIIESRDRKDLIYKGFDGTQTIIGKAYGGGKKWLSLFSFLFVLLIVFITVLLLLDRLTSLIPDSLYFEGILQPSLRTRIQASILTLILASFVIIAFVTIAFFRSSSLSYFEDNLQVKFNAVISDIRHEIDLISAYPDTLSWTGLIRPIAAIHGMDINVYDTKGRLLSSSADYIYKKGIKAPLMNPVALQNLRSGSDRLQVQAEHIGQLAFQAAYTRIEDPRLGMFYLGLPFYGRDRTLRSDIYEFMGTLMSTYVFLLLIAGAIGIFVTNSITRPISKIGEKLKLLQLGTKNEPLEWNTRDELGDLIRQYNLMVKQLEESTQKLRQSEREGAWREMARQVAHEIKNPLTPMKLSIQHLLHVQRFDPDKTEPLLKRVANTLIEQIDSLSRIASEFSNFAQMPKAENQYFSVNELVSKAFDLFEKNQPDNLELELSLPEKAYTIFADKEHLVRVLNNLITNAIQAIPEERKGKISIDMRENDGLLVLEIRDNGKGIPEETRDSVFSPYFTTKSSGTGLGLAISKNIIEAMNGKIYFKTVTGLGTSFFIELPVLNTRDQQD